MSSITVSDHSCTWRYSIPIEPVWQQPSVGHLIIAQCYQIDACVADFVPCDQQRCNWEVIAATCKRARNFMVLMRSSRTGMNRMNVIGLGLPFPAISKCGDCQGVPLYSITRPPFLFTLLSDPKTVLCLFMTRLPSGRPTRQKAEIQDGRCVCTSKKLK